MNLSMVVAATVLFVMQYALGQTVSHSGTVRGGLSSAYVVVPQTRSFGAVHIGGGVSPSVVEVSRVTASVDILEQVATTTLDVALTNRGGARMESQMVVPAPAGAVLKGFTFQGSAAEAKAELLARDEARRLYDSIVARTRDPALLEFLGCNLIQSSVFPVEAYGGQKVRIVYEQLLPRDGDRVDFTLPRSESLEYRVPWNMTVRIKSKSSIGAVYSPSHTVDVTRQGDSAVLVRMRSDASTEPGPFRLSYLVKRSEMAATLLAYPDAKIGGGYFLLLAGAPARSPDADPIKREVILVLDRSGSMAGEKLEQVRSAALQVLEALEDGESFNIIVYNESVELFAPGPLVKSEGTMQLARKYLRSLRARGGTNIHDALQEALRMQSTAGTLPLVLFLTDGLPTVGQTSEKAIREIVSKGNPHQRRVFTFGVGVDVNTPLLDKMALATRANSTFVLPQEDVEVKVGEVFRRLSGPVLAEPTLRTYNEDGTLALGRVRERLPGPLPDIFDGDQLIVLGQYTGADPLIFKLLGRTAGREREFQFRFDLDHATTRNAFVPRLWASRRIAVLTDAIRDLGVDSGTNLAASSGDLRLKELVEEVVKLSKEFGILSEYTAFLAREGTDLNQSLALVNEAYRNFDNRAVKTRTGFDSVSQSLNNDFKRSQIVDNSRNLFYDAQMNAVEISTVQQVNSRAFYKRGNRWIDSALVDETDKTTAIRPRVIEFGSEEFRRLAERLAAENRQGAFTLKGEILLKDGEEAILVR